MKKIWNWIIGLLSLIGAILVYGLFSSKDNREMKKALEEVEDKQEKKQKEIDAQKGEDERVINELMDKEEVMEQLQKANDKKIDEAGEDIEKKEFNDPNLSAEYVDDLLGKHSED